jgi:hypothetical protein
MKKCVMYNTVYIEDIIKLLQMFVNAAKKKIKRIILWYLILIN